MKSKASGLLRAKKKANPIPWIVPFAAFFLLLFPLSKDAYPWRGQVHTRMTNDALKVMPRLPDDLFKKNAKELKEGALEPEPTLYLKPL